LIFIKKYDIIYIESKGKEMINMKIVRVKAKVVSPKIYTQEDMDAMSAELASCRNQIISLKQRNVQLADDFDIEKKNCALATAEVTALRLALKAYRPNLVETQPINVGAQLDEVLMSFERENGTLRQIDDNGNHLAGVIEDVFVEANYDVRDYDINSNVVFSSPAADFGYVSVTWIENGKLRHRTYEFE
jgi:hypothetical protein